MAKIEIIIKDEQGKELTQLQSLDLELGNQSLAEIEKAVENLKQKMLPEISSELLSKAQREFTEDKKKTQSYCAMARIQSKSRQFMVNLTFACKNI